MTPEHVKQEQMSTSALCVAFALKRTCELEPRFKIYFGERLALLNHILKTALANRPFRFKFSDILIKLLLPLPNSIQRKFFDINVKGYDLLMAARKVMIQGKIDHAINNGIEQIVNLGGGFDCGLVISAKSTPAVNYYELDLDGLTRESKLKALQTFQDNNQINIFNLKNISTEIVCCNKNMFFIKSNLLDNKLVSALDAAGFNAKKKTLFIAEGLTMYLTPEAMNTSFLPQLSSILNDQSEVIISMMAPVTPPLFTRILHKATVEPLLFFKAPQEAIKYFKAYDLTIKQRYTSQSSNLLDIANNFQDKYNLPQKTFEPYYILTKKTQLTPSYVNFDEIPEISSEMMKLKDRNNTNTVHEYSATQYTHSRSQYTPNLSNRKLIPYISTIEDYHEKLKEKEENKRCSCVIQ